MKKKILLLVVLAVVGGAWLLYNFWENEQSSQLTLFGNVDVRQVDLSFRVSGLVDQVLVDEGDAVHPGMLVAVLDDQPYVDEVKRAEAEEVATKVRAENAQLVFARREALVGSTAVSQEDFDDALAARNEAVAQHEAAVATLAIAKENLAYTKVYAPTDGWILTRVREPGSVVQPSNPVLTESVKSPVWVRAYVAEPDLGRITFGMEGEVFTDTKGGKVYHGHIGFISPVAEFTPKTVQTQSLRTDLVYRLRVIIDDPDEFLRQGMPVTVRFP